ncbi:hypothetical protein ABQ144_23350, partial [Xanthomonas hortorum pv. hederae]
YFCFAGVFMHRSFWQFARCPSCKGGSVGSSSAKLFRMICDAVMGKHWSSYWRSLNLIRPLPTRRQAERDGPWI